MTDEHLRKWATRQQDYPSAWADLARTVLLVLAERDRLLAAVVSHHAQRADDRCWLDDVELYAAAGLPADGVNLVGDQVAMLKNCERFVANRCAGGGPWQSYADLLAERDALRGRVAELEARPPTPVYVPAARCEACRGRGRFDISPVCHWCGGTGLDRDRKGDAT